MNTLSRVVTILLLGQQLVCNGRYTDNNDGSSTNNAEEANPNHGQPAHSYQSGGGVVYERWGRYECPVGANVLYTGLVAGAWYDSNGGGGANYICMPTDPSYTSTASVSRPSKIFSTEYETYDEVFSTPTHNSDAPCVVCHVPTRSTKFMKPAATECPSPWSMEYNGYLMSSSSSHTVNTGYICVDGYPEVIYGSGDDENGALLYFVTADCANHKTLITCPPFDDWAPITCVVCTL